MNHVIYTIMFNLKKEHKGVYFKVSLSQGTPWILGVAHYDLHFRVATTNAPNSSLSAHMNFTLSFA